MDEFHFKIVVTLLSFYFCCRTQASVPSYQIGQATCLNLIQPSLKTKFISLYISAHFSVLDIPPLSILLDIFSTFFMLTIGKFQERQDNQKKASLWSWCTTMHLQMKKVQKKIRLTKCCWNNSFSIQKPLYFENISLF